MRRAFVMVRRLAVMGQRGQLGLHCAHRRVAIATILLAFGFIPEHVLFGKLDQSLRRIKRVDGCLNDGYGQAVVRTKTLLTGVHGLRR